MLKKIRENYSGEYSGPPKSYASLEASHWQLPETPFHNGLQKVEGEVH